MHAIEVGLDFWNATACRQGSPENNQVGGQGRVTHGEDKPHRVRGPKSTVRCDDMLDCSVFEAVEAL